MISVAVSAGSADWSAISCAISSRVLLEADVTRLMSAYLHGFNFGLQPGCQLLVTRTCLVQLGIGLMQRCLCLQCGQQSLSTAASAEPVNQLRTHFFPNHAGNSESQRIGRTLKFP